MFEKLLFKLINMNPNWIVAIGTAILAFVAWRQLNKLNRTLKINSLMAVLELESEMFRKKEKYEETVSSYKMMEMGLNIGDSVYISVKKEDIKSALENYLYSLNRLCYCIKNKPILEDKDWKLEFHELISAVVDENKECFDVSLPKYPNIIYINKKWNSE